MKKIKVGIVIATHNGATHIHSVLASISKLTYPTLHTYLVDNASTDDTIKITQRFKSVTIIANPTHLGYTHANNQGIKAALANNCDYVMILADDTEFDNTLVEHLIQPFLHSQLIACVGCTATYFDKPSTLWFHGGKLSNWGYTTHPDMDFPLIEINHYDRPVDFISGVCVLISRSAFEKVGLLNEQYRIFFEDVEWCYRARQLGYSCWLIDKPLLKHKVSSSTGVKGTNRLTSFRAFYFGRNPFILVKDHFKGWQKLTGFLGQFFIRLPFYGFRVVKVGDWPALKEYLRGMAAGIKYFFTLT